MPAHFRRVAALTGIALLLAVAELDGAEEQVRMSKIFGRRIRNRTLTDGEFNTLNTSPYIFITAPSAGGPPLGSLQLLGVGR